MFTVGADPEIFVKQKGKAVSAHGLVEGDKKNPLKTSKGAVQVDGMALEFNIDPVSAGDFESFNKNIVQTVKELRTLVGSDYNFNPSPVQEFDSDYLEAQPEEAKELGCDPDFNAYTLEENPMPDGTRNFRTGAGHIHIGWGSDIPVDNQDHFEICANFIKFMDATVGMAMTVIDQDPRRRELYGKAGAFRPKSYGVEYRTPSNVWITSKDKRKMIFFFVQQGILNAGSGYTTQEYYRRYFTDVENIDEKVQNIINSGDAQGAYDFLFKTVYLPHEFSRLLKESL